MIYLFDSTLKKRSIGHRLHTQHTVITIKIFWNGAKTKRKLQQGKERREDIR